MIDNSLKAQLVDELTAFDPAYRETYDTIGAAAYDAGAYVFNLYLDYMRSESGVSLAAMKTTTQDWNELNRLNRKQIAADRALAGASGAPIVTD